MKDDYLKRLEEELNKLNVINKDDILEKYRKRYDFGLEAEMSEDEIEAMLGDPCDIASKQGNAFKNEIVELNEANALDFKINISSLNDDIEIIDFDCDRPKVDLSLTDKDIYVLDDSDKMLSLKAKKRSFFSFNRKSGLIKVYISKKIKYNDIVISTTSGDIKSCDINSANLEINAVSGDLKLDNIDADDFMLNLVSGDALISDVFSKNISIETVSSDVKIDFLVSDETRIETVSGDVVINQAKGNIKSSSISGDIIINSNKNNTNVMDYLKGVVKKWKRE